MCIHVHRLQILQAKLHRLQVIVYAQHIKLNFIHISFLSLSSFIDLV